MESTEGTGKSEVQGGETGGAAGGGVVGSTAEAVQNSRLETIFYITLFITLVHAGFIFWDMVAMLPGAGRLFGLSAANEVKASGDMSTLYLTFLGMYAGYKEFLRWVGKKEQAEVPQAQAIRFKRGEVIVTFWTALLVVAISLMQMRLIARLPEELFRTTMQAIGILFGTYVSKGLSQSRKGEAAAEEDAVSRKDYSKDILDCIAKQGFIDNKSCRELTGLTRSQVTRLLSQLETDGVITVEGKRRNARYYRAEASN